MNGNVKLPLTRLKDSIKADLRMNGPKYAQDDIEETLDNLELPVGMSDRDKFATFFKARLKQL